MEQEIVCYLIDDDPDDQEIFGLGLNELNLPAKCFTADSCPDAIERLKNDPSFKPDYIFIDLNMPRMGGRECISELKKMAWLADIPLIIYSTSSELKDIRETHELGANYFLTKPFTVSILVKKLNDFFQKMKNNVPMDYQI